MIAATAIPNVAMKVMIEVFASDTSPFVARYGRIASSFATRSFTPSLLGGWLPPATVLSPPL